MQYNAGPAHIAVDAGQVGGWAVDEAVGGIIMKSPYCRPWLMVFDTILNLKSLWS